MAIKTIKDLMPDSHNANKGTVRGAKMIEASLQQDGFGRPVLVDKNGQLIAGNKTVQGVADTFGIDTEVVLVKTTGNKVIVHQREDLDLESDDLNNPARRLAYRDNLAGHFSFELAPEVVLADFEGGFDFDDIGVKVEDLAVLLPDVSEFGVNGNWGDAFGGLPEEDRAPFQQMTFTLHDSQVEIVKDAIARAKDNDFSDTPNANSNGNALSFICEAFIDD